MTDRDKEKPSEYNAEVSPASRYTRTHAFYNIVNVAMGANIMHDLPKAAGLGIVVGLLTLANMANDSVERDVTNNIVFGLPNSAKSTVRTITQGLAAITSFIGFVKNMPELQIAGMSVAAAWNVADIVDDVRPPEFKSHSSKMKNKL